MEILVSNIGCPLVPVSATIKRYSCVLNCIFYCLHWHNWYWNYCSLSLHCTVQFTIWTALNYRKLCVALLTFWTVCESVINCVQYFIAPCIKAWSNLRSQINLIIDRMIPHGHLKTIHSCFMISYYFFLIQKNVLSYTSTVKASNYDSKNVNKREVAMHV